MTPPEPDQLLRPREVARLLDVRVPQVAWWARTGVLEPSVRTPGGHRRYRRADILAFRATAAEPTPERRRQETDAVRLYEQGWSIRQVGARLGWGYGPTRRVLLRHTTLRTRSERRTP